MYNDDEARLGIWAAGLTEGKYRLMAAALGVPGAMTDSIGQVMYTVINGGNYRDQARQIAHDQRRGDRG